MKKETPFTLADAKRGLSSMFRHTAGYRKELSWAFALVLLSGIIAGFQPFIFGKVVDTMTSSGGTQGEALFMIAVFGVSLFLVHAISNVQGRISSVTEEQMRLSYMHRVAKRLLRLPLSFHKTYRSGEVSDKVMRGAQAIPLFWSEYVFNILPELIYVALALVIAFTLAPQIGWLLVISGILFSLVSASFVQPFARIQRSMQDAYSKARGIANDVLFNVKMVKDAAFEDQEDSRLEKAWFEGPFPIWKSLTVKSRNLAIAQNAISITARVAAILLAYKAFAAGAITIGSFTAIASYVSGFFSPLQALFRRWRSIQNGLISIEDSDKLLAKETEKYIGTKTDSVRGRIEFKDVSFGHEGNPAILDSISFVAEPGEVVALVGESGVGKSSLMELVSAYQFPQKGSIEIDGIPSTEIDLTFLRSSIAVVSQEITLFNESVFDNIQYGVEGATKERVEWAARMAKCDFIERLPKKWDQHVGERGMKLSVGQKQRIAIARAFLRDPKILVLDEPTSALDASSEQHILQSLDGIMKGRTTLIIAHRLSTVRTANKILVFKDGRLVETGSYKELSEGKGEFRRLLDLQTLNE